MDFSMAGAEAARAGEDAAAAELGQGGVQTRKRTASAAGFLASGGGLEEAVAAIRRRTVTGPFAVGGSREGEQRMEQELQV